MRERAHGKKTVSNLQADRFLRSLVLESARRKLVKHLAASNYVLLTSSASKEFFGPLEALCQR